MLTPSSYRTLQQQNKEIKWEIRQPEEDSQGFRILKQICVQLAHRTNTHTVIMLWKIQKSEYEKSVMQVENW